MKRYYASGLIEQDLPGVHPPFVSGAHDGCWISATNKKEAIREFVRMMDKCYGLIIRKETVTIYD